MSIMQNLRLHDPCKGFIKFIVWTFSIVSWAKKTFSQACFDTCNISFPKSNHLVGLRSACFRSCTRQSSSGKFIRLQAFIMIAKHSIIINQLSWADFESPDFEGGQFLTAMRRGCKTDWCLQVERGQTLLIGRIANSPRWIPELDQ